MARPPDGIVAPPGLLTRPAASPLSTVTESSRITHPQPAPSRVVLLFPSVADGPLALTDCT